MPEGDTVHRVARVLAAELTGQTLSEIKLHDRGEVPELAGCTIESVEAAGKHLLVDFSGDWTLRVHLGMHGRWLRKHVREPRPGGLLENDASPQERDGYAPETDAGSANSSAICATEDTPWRRPVRSGGRGFVLQQPPKDWTVIITTGEIAYVCRRSYRAELVRTSALHAHPRLARLGPDLLADPPRIDDMVRRARLPGHAEREIGDVLLDQRVASGIGNVYKSEVLFEVRVHPCTKVRELSDDFIESYLVAEWPEVSQCVGVFRIEALGPQLFESIEGDMFTVLGMPLLPVLGALREFGKLPA